MTKTNKTSVANTLKRTVSVGALAAVLATGTVSALQAQTPAPPKTDAPAEVKPAPELAPGIAPGVVPGARPGGMEDPKPTPTQEAQPGIAPGVVPGARPGGMEAGAPLGNHPAFTPDAAVTPSDNAAVKFSPADIISSPDWPCVQRKVPIISPAQVWDGPPIDGIKEFDPSIRDLTEVLESRRVSHPRMPRRRSRSSPPSSRRPSATRSSPSCSPACWTKINTDRQFVMAKVEDFQKRQKGRAAELEREGQKLAEKGIAATDELLPTETKLTPEQQEYNWNARIFQERQQNLTHGVRDPGSHRAARLRNRPPDPRADEELTVRPLRRLGARSHSRSKPEDGGREALSRQLLHVDERIAKLLPAVGAVTKPHDVGVAVFERALGGVPRHPAVLEAEEH